MKLRKVLLSSAILSGSLFTFIACGNTNNNDGNNLNNNNINSQKINIRGVAIDPEIQGATVFLDSNGNGVYDEGEPTSTTDNLGQYVLEIPNEDIGKSIIVSGGVDSVTKEDFVGELSAISDNTQEQIHITPLSTLVNNYKINNDVSAKEAKEQIATQLDIEVEDLAKKTTKEGNEKLLKISLRIQKVAEALKNNDDKIKVKDIYKSIAKKLKHDKLSSAIDKTIDETETKDSLSSEKIKDLDRELKSINTDGLSADGLALTVDNIKTEVDKATSKDHLNKDLHSRDTIRVQSDDDVKKEKSNRAFDKLDLGDLDDKTKETIRNSNIDFKHSSIEDIKKRIESDDSILNEQERDHVKSVSEKARDSKKKLEEHGSQSNSSGEQDSENGGSSGHSTGQASGEQSTTTPPQTGGQASGGQDSGGGGHSGGGGERRR